MPWMYLTVLSGITILSSASQSTLFRNALSFASFTMSRSSGCIRCNHWSNVVFYFLILRARTLGAGGGLFVTGAMWCPALAAFATLKLNRRRLSELGWKWPARRYALASWYIPLCYAAIAYVIVWVSGLGAFPNHQFMDSLVARFGLGLSPTASTILYVALMGTLGIVGSMSRALGEEIGWRGFLVPEMSKTFSFTATALISGIVWSLWHYPVLIFAD